MAKPTEMTLTEALIRAKNIRRDINSDFSKYKLVHIVPGVVISNKSKAKKEQIETMKREMQSSYDKVSSLIRNYIALKSAITYTNSTTRVEYMGSHYYLAELISLNSPDVRGAIIQMLTQLEKSNSDEVNSIGKMNNNMINYAKEHSSSIDAKDFIQIFDPFDNIGRIKELKEYYTKFFDDLDSTLSKINSTTTIIVELEG